jgi:hypothetical protein
MQEQAFHVAALGFDLRLAWTVLPVAVEANRLLKVKTRVFRERCFSDAPIEGDVQWRDHSTGILTRSTLFESEADREAIRIEVAPGTWPSVRFPRPEFSARISGPSSAPKCSSSRRPRERWVLTSRLKRQCPGACVALSVNPRLVELPRRANRIGARPRVAMSVDLRL